METLCLNSLVQNSSWWTPEGCRATWTKEENKKFENALAIFDEKTPDRWFRVADMIPGKSVYDVMNQYNVLVADVSNIEAGLVPIPGYLASSFTLELEDHRVGMYRKRARMGDHERKRGVPWTEDEHRRFLLGLQKHGKGDWRSISRNFVISKTPTQVASHAQKYYLRQLSEGKDKRRPSIHDITTVNLPNALPTKINNNNNNNDKQPLWDKCNEFTKPLQSPATSTQNALLDWIDANDDSLTVFSSSCGDSFLAYPHNTTTNNRCIVNVGGLTTGLHARATRFRN